MFCPECGTKNDDTAKFCTHCGQPMPASEPVPPPRRKRWLLFLGLGLLAIAVIAGAILASLHFLPPAGKATPTSETTKAKRTPTASAASTVVTGPGGAQLAFPPGTAVDVSGVTIREVTDGPPPGDGMVLASPVFEIAGADSILPAPAKLTLPLIPEALLQRDEHSMLVVAWWNGSQWLPIGGEVDEWRQEITVETGHLSLFAAISIGSASLETDHFRIHALCIPKPQWDVGELGTELERAWQLVIGHMGYAIPRQVQEGHKVRVWVLSIGEPGKIEPGLIWVDRLKGYARYHIYINCRLPQSELHSIAAHEFFHIVQVNSYLYPLSDLQLKPVQWWMEATATWMAAKSLGDRETDLLWGVLQGKPDASLLASPLDRAEAPHMYRASLFARYLEERQGADVIKDSWSRLAASYSPFQALDDALAGEGMSLSQAYWDFALQYGYLRESKWLQDTMGLPADAPEAQAGSLQVSTSPQRRTVQSPHLSGQVFELLPAGLGTLQLRFDGGAHRDVWRIQVLVERPDGSVESREIASPQREVAVPGFGAQVERVVVVAANTSLDRDGASVDIDAQLLVPTPTPTYTPIPTFTPTPIPTPTPAPTPHLLPPEPPPGGYELQRVGHLNGNVAGVAVQRQYAYVGCVPPGLMVIDVSDPARPREVGRTALLPRLVDERMAGVTDVAVQDNYAYVTAWSEGLWVIDVSTPSDPRQVGFYENRGLIMNVFVSGPYAYIATGSGLSIVDVSDPARPHQVAYYAAEGIYRGDGIADVFVSGRYAYLSHYYHGLIVLDVSDPTRPRQVGSNQTPGGDAGVAVSGSFAYTVSAFPIDGRRGFDGLRVYDVSNPGDPKEVGSLDAGYPNPGNWDAPIATSGRYLYLSAWAHGLRVIDVSDPAQPQEVGSLDMQGTLAVSGGYVYLAGGPDGLFILHFTGEAVTAPLSARTRSVQMEAGTLSLWPGLRTPRPGSRRSGEMTGCFPPNDTGRALGTRV